MRGRKGEEGMRRGREKERCRGGKVEWRRGGAERRIEEEEGWRGGREEGERRRGRREERKKGVEGVGEVRRRRVGEEEGMRR